MLQAPLDLFFASSYNSLHQNLSRTLKRAAGRAEEMRRVLVTEKNASESRVEGLEMELEKLRELLRDESRAAEQQAVLQLIESGKGTADSVQAAINKRTEEERRAIEETARKSKIRAKEMEQTAKLYDGQVKESIRGLRDVGVVNERMQAVRVELNAYYFACLNPLYCRINLQHTHTGNHIGRK